MLSSFHHYYHFADKKLNQGERKGEKTFRSSTWIVIGLRLSAEAALFRSAVSLCPTLFSSPGVTGGRPGGSDVYVIHFHISL